MPPTGGRGIILSDAQENAIVDMVIGNNAIKLREIQDRVMADNIIFWECEYGQHNDNCQSPRET